MTINKQETPFLTVIIFPAPLWSDYKMIQFIVPLGRVPNPHKPFFSFSALSIRSLPFRCYKGEKRERTVSVEQAEKSSDSGVVVAVAVEGQGMRAGAGRPLGGWDRGPRCRPGARLGVKAGMWRLQVGWVLQGAALTFWWHPRLRICLSLSRAVVWWKKGVF